MSIKDVLRNELELISVSKNEVLRLKKISSDFIKSLKGYGLKAFVGGSLAKGTLVAKEKQDVDIFVVFDYSEDTLKLGGILEKMKLPGKLSKVHGSRDYFHIDLGDVVLEVIPVVKNSDPELAENVTDMSLSHVKYVVSEIKKKPELAGEIMLAKAFCRANRCYGAEGYVRGFSGYSLEILVIHFGSFVKFLKEMHKVRVVDSMKYFKNEREIMRELNSNKLQGPVVVVDPTFKFRNVCAGLGSESFEMFLEVGLAFLKRPSLEFFVKKDLDVEAMRDWAIKKKVRFLELELSTDRQEGDIAGTKMKKIFDFFVRELKRNGQEILRSEFDYSGVEQKARGFLVVKENIEVEVRGPSVGLQECVLEFKKAKGSSVFERKGFWWFRKKVSVEGILVFVKKVEGEMGVKIDLV
ncbi:MAG: nucleotidyltransferase domain-containing protein [archaeon]